MKRPYFALSFGDEEKKFYNVDCQQVVTGPCIERGKFYYALYQFNATDSTMMSLYRGKVR
jgi:hypothetical protein